MMKLMYCMRIVKDFKNLEIYSEVIELGEEDEN